MARVRANQVTVGALASLLLLSRAEAQVSPRAVPVPASTSGEARKADSTGLVAWSEYEGRAHMAQMWTPRDASLISTPKGAPIQFDQAQIALVERGTGKRNKVAGTLKELARFIEPPPGDGAYKQALGYFREAQRLDSTNVAILRHVLRAYAEKSDWAAMLGTAQTMLRANPEATEAWLAQGLALHRQEKYDSAGAAFDNAIRRMKPEDRAPYLSMSRLVAPKAYGRRMRFPDAEELAAMPGAEQQYWNNLFWDLADPRPSTRVNEAKLEYFARLAYVDLRWTNDAGERGIDSDRGAVYVRYGPPELIYNLGNHIWTYRDNSVFFFGRVAGYDARKIAQREREVMEDSMFIEKPVSWANMPLVRNSWPMLMRVARFRSLNDSVDAIVAAAVPVRSLLGNAELGGNLPIDVHLDVRDPESRIVGAEKRRVEVNREKLPTAINGTWVRRLGRGTNVVRLDAQQPDVGRGAFANEDFVVDSLEGFGMSDILFGSLPKDMGGASPTSWRDSKIAPTVALTSYSQPLGMVWETYDLTSRNGKVDYEVTLELERTFKKSLAGFTARITRNLVNVITQSGSATGKVSLTFKESRPQNAVIANALSVDLNGSVSGPYRLRISVKDLHTGQVTSRTTLFELVED